MGKNEEIRKMLVNDFAKYLDDLSDEMLLNAVHTVVPPIYDTPAQFFSSNTKAFFPRFIDRAWRNMGHSFNCDPDQSVPECNACHPK